MVVALGVNAPDIYIPDLHIESGLMVKPRDSGRAYQVAYAPIDIRWRLSAPHTITERITSSPARRCHSAHAGTSSIVATEPLPSTARAAEPKGWLGAALALNAVFNGVADERKRTNIALLPSYSNSPSLSLFGLLR